MSKNTNTPGVYTMRPTDDPEIFAFWNTYTVNKQERPMLCFTMHSDCIDSSLMNYYRENGPMNVELIVNG